MMDEHRLALSIYDRRFNLIIKAIHQSLKIAVPKKESVNRKTHTHTELYCYVLSHTTKYAQNDL